MQFLWQTWHSKEKKSEKSEEFANVNFSLSVWVSGLKIVTARSAIDPCNTTPTLICFPHSFDRLKVLRFRFTVWLGLRLRTWWKRSLEEELIYSKSFIKNTDSAGIVLFPAFAPHIYSVRSYSKYGSCKSCVLRSETNRLQAFLSSHFAMALDYISMKSHV